MVFALPGPGRFTGVRDRGVHAVYLLATAMGWLLTPKTGEQTSGSTLTSSATFWIRRSHPGTAGPDRVTARTGELAHG